MRSLPVTVEQPELQLNGLRYLELKRVDIDPEALEQLVLRCSQSLKEIYLNEVYLKVFGSNDRQTTALWIGHPHLKKPEKARWLAQSLREMDGLKLDVLRATGLGYDDFDPDRTSNFPDYDLIDPTGRDRDFDQRFVEAVFNDDVDMDDAPLDEAPPHQPAALVSIPQAGHLLTLPEALALPPEAAVAEEMAINRELTSAQHASESRDSQPQSPPSEVAVDLENKLSYDAESYQRYHNTTSHFKRCIDGYFFNHNEQALKELQRIITVADRGMSLLAAEMDRSHALRLDPSQGNLTGP